MSGVSSIGVAAQALTPASSGFRGRAGGGLGAGASTNTQTTVTNGGSSTSTISEFRGAAISTVTTQTQAAPPQTANNVVATATSDRRSGSRSLLNLIA